MDKPVLVLIKKEFYEGDLVFSISAIGGPDLSFSPDDLQTYLIESGQDEFSKRYRRDQEIGPFRSRENILDFVFALLSELKKAFPAYSKISLEGFRIISQNEFARAVENSSTKADLWTNLKLSGDFHHFPEAKKAHFLERFFQ